MNLKEEASGLVSFLMGIVLVFILKQIGLGPFAYLMGVALVFVVLVLKNGDAALLTSSEKQ